MSRPDAFVPVAVTRRSGHDESVHFGVVVVLGPSGDVEFAAGDPSVAIYPRSSNKPMQATAMVRAGLSLPPELLALVSASHDGTPMHVAAARRILASAGLDETALGNTPDLPLDTAAAHAVLRAGGDRAAITMNCSGKHSGMVATCVINGWPHDRSYLDPEHPLQQRITATIAELAGETPSHIGVDGCGAPAHVLSVIGLARAFRSIVTGAAGESGRAVHDAVRMHPAMVAGEGDTLTTMLRHVPGLLAKDGADGVFAAALPDGRAIALKVADGSARARPAVALAAMEQVGIDTSAFAPLVRQPILGHGHPVGQVRAVLP